MAVAGAAVAAVTGGTLFQYNRKNFMYDRSMRQEAEFTSMEFSIRQAELWREDVKDIIGLTSVKLDTYLVVCAIELIFVTMTWTEGRFETDNTPLWLVGASSLTLSAAFMYLLMSIWFAMLGIVTAKSYEVRLLTQHVRLPVPTWQQLEGTRSYASTYERTGGRQMFRVPFAQGSHQRATPASSSAEPSHCYNIEEGHEILPAPLDDETKDPWGLERTDQYNYELDGVIRKDVRQLRHVKLIHEASRYWQAYDAFARVCLTMGTSAFITGICYYILGYVMYQMRCVVAAFADIFLLVTIQITLIRLDMSMSIRDYVLTCILMGFPPCALAVCMEQTLLGRGSSTLVRALAPLAYFFCAAWMFMMPRLCKVIEAEGGQSLPSGFRSVLYVDVFGWIKQKVRSSQELLTAEKVKENKEPFLPGSGPGIQSVRYDEAGNPITNSQGWSNTGFPDSAKVHRNDLRPESFVPPGMQGSGPCMSTHNVLGATPWRVFWSSTILLSIMWVAAGTFVVLELLGLQQLAVQPILSIWEKWDNPTMTSNDEHPLTGDTTLETIWPRTTIHPVNIAYDAPNGIMVAVSRFNLYYTYFEEPRRSTVQPQVNFSKTLFCESIEGEDLQDVSLYCNEGACNAYVLHRSGTMISTCPITESEDNATLPRAESSVSQSWLHLDEDAGNELIDTFAVSTSCAWDGTNATSALCAYVGTSERRILEIQQHGKGQRDPLWYPMRHLVTDINKTISLGPFLDVVGGRFLAKLSRQTASVDVLDLKNGGVGWRWVLEEPSSQWIGLSFGERYIYILGNKDGVFTLHRFPIPSGFSDALAAINSESVFSKLVDGLQQK